MITVATGIVSTVMYMWTPFLPLFMRDLGVDSEASAVSWVAIALTCQGVASLASGPIWGWLSDRYGRKLMFVRSLFATALTAFILGSATAPWHVAVAMAALGLLGGYVQAGSALVSVVVPDADLKTGLARVSGALYIGSMAGPALGSLLAIWMSFRGTIFVSALASVVVAAAAARLVPADRTRFASTGKRELEPLNPTPQLGLAILLYLLVFGLNQLIMVATPSALNLLSGQSRAVGVSGLAFTLAGVASAVGVFVVSTRFFLTGSLRRSLGAAALIIAAAHAVMAASGGVTLYIAAFIVISLLEAAMIPVTSTLIAMNVTASRRGTAFGLVTAARAIALSAGPGGAALMTATSLRTGLVVIAVLFVGLAVLIRTALREGALVSAPAKAR